MADLLTSHTYSPPFSCSHSWLLLYLAKLYRRMWLHYWCRACTVCSSLMLELLLWLFLSFSFLSFSLCLLSFPLSSGLSWMMNDVSDIKSWLWWRERLFLCETGWTHPSKTSMLFLNDFSVLKHYSLAKKYSISVETGSTMSTVVALLRGKAIQPQIECRYYSLIHKVSKARYFYNCRICYVYSSSPV